MENPQEEPKMEVLPPTGIEEKFLGLQQERVAKALLALEENMAGVSADSLTLLLQKVKAGSGGATGLRVENASGAERTFDELEAIILASRTARLYYPRTTRTGNRPPQCTSVNGFVGIGDPGGECHKCPYKKFGTAINPDGSQGAGQACKEIRQVLMLLPGELMPHLLNVPPTSIRNFEKYFMGLGSKGVPYWSCITKITGEAARSDNGQPYSKLRFQMEKELGEGLLRNIAPYRSRMRDLLIPSIVDASAYEVVDQDAEPAAPQSRRRHYEDSDQPQDSEVPF